MVWILRGTGEDYRANRREGLGDCSEEWGWCVHERALSSGNLMEFRFSAFFMRYGVIFNMSLQLDVCMILCFQTG